MNTISHRPGRIFGVILMLVLIVGCEKRPGDQVLNPVPVPPGTTRMVEVHTATNRSIRADFPVAFGQDRAADMIWSRFEISIPPTHQPAQIEWPEDKADPSQSFAVAKRWDMTANAFVDSLVGDRRTRDVAVFVHGYNTTFQEALFRQAQMAADAQSDEASLAFVWPSSGTVPGYLADREAATYSRDQLVALLTTLSTDPRIDDITVLAHSMGGWLTMEALRQLRLTGRDDVLDRLQVTLAAPDIDIDVFETQIAVIGPLDPPLTVLTASDDAALQIASRLNAGRPRIGAVDISDPRISAIAMAENVALIDITNLEAQDTLGHSRYAILAAMSSQVDPDEANPIRSAGAFVLETVGTTLASPFVLAAEVIR